MILCQKTDNDFWEATYQEIDVSLKAAMKFEQEHTLPLLAIQATWAAVQQRQEKKMLSIEKLMGTDDKQASGPMSKTEMLTEVGKLADFQAKWKAKQRKKKKKEEEEANLESA